MIIVSIRGGLGNQMFQYACGRAIAHRLNTELKLDLTAFSQVADNKELTKRGFELDIFNISAKPAHEDEIKCFVSIDPQSPKYQLLHYKIKRAFSKKHLILENTPLIYDPSLNQIHNETYLSGYWQSELYFKDNFSQIRKEFTLKHELSFKAKQILQQIESCNAVSLHIRHGDFLNEKNRKIHGVLSSDYYKQAVNIISSKLSDARFFIFTDDILWAKANYNLKLPYIIVDRETANKSYEDMWLMSKCKHHIVANSSFSWWGAWLNPHENKIVVAPKNWIVNMPANADILPKGWISI